MKSSLAWIAAATFGIVAATTTVAVASHTGMLGFSSPNRPVGQLTSSQVNAMLGQSAEGLSASSTVAASAPTTTEQPIIIRYEDVYITVPPTSRSAATPTGQTPVDPDLMTGPLVDTAVQAAPEQYVSAEPSSGYSDDDEDDDSDEYEDDYEEDHAGENSGRKSQTFEHISEGEDDDD
jgi:hypothetical protein